MGGAVRHADIEVIPHEALWTTLEKEVRIAVLIALPVKLPTVQLGLFSINLAGGDALLQPWGKKFEVVYHFLDQPGLVLIAGRLENWEEVGIA